MAGSSTRPTCSLLANSTTRKGEMTHRGEYEPDDSLLRGMGIGSIAVVVWAVPTCPPPSGCRRKVIEDRNRYSYASYDAVELL